MALPLLVEQAFSGEQKILTEIQHVLRDRPQYSHVFEGIAQLVLRTRVVPSPSSARPSHAAEASDDSPRKKRRLDSPQPIDLEVTLNTTPRPQTGVSPDGTDAKSLLLEARDLSFSLPARKKLHFGIVQYGSDVKSPAPKFGIQGRNAATNAVEFEYPSTSFEYAFRLPVPEKAQKQYNFVLIPKSAAREGGETVIWTVNHGPLKSVKIEDDGLKQIISSPDDILEKTLNFVFQKSGFGLVMPDEREFASANRESHRKNEVAYHVKAFRGSKEGYLFFLPTGIFFGFKKPLVFYPFDLVDSVSYTSITKRTFNLNISARILPDDDDDDPQETEYSMLDQADFGGIDTYIKRHQLQDASLAEARRARKTGKQAQTNSARGTENGVDGSDAASGGMTELEKAQQELEDEEDEMEEDYDPDEDDGSGVSDSGSSDGEEEYKAGKGRNLVAEELGSEAEDVSASEDENGDEDELDFEEKDDNDGLDTHIPARPVQQRKQKPEVNGVKLARPTVQALPKSQPHPRSGVVAKSEPGIDDQDQL